MIIVPHDSQFHLGRLDIPVTDRYSFSIIDVEESYTYGGRLVNFDLFLLKAFFESDEELLIVNCPTIIGMGNDLVSIEPLDDTIKGQKISKGNLGKWRLVINE